MNRRGLLKAVVGGTAATALTGIAKARITSRTITIRSAGTSGHSYSGALERLAAFAERDLASAGVPGMTMCLVDAEGFSAVGTFGLADIAGRAPVQPSHLFQVGSISKSLGALCIHRLADEGRVDLTAPMSRYLPDVPLPTEPILVQQVLSHTAGLPRRAPVFSAAAEQRLWTGFTPGTDYSYSNTGFELIGMLVERICGKPYPRALRDLVIRPLGITGLKEVIQASDRARYAIGYAPLDAAGPNMPGVQLGPTQWVNYDTADCNIGASGGAMARYLQFLISVGRGVGAPVLSDVATRRFSRVVEAAATFDNGAGYASGLEVIELEGHTAFHHLGGMWGFTSSMTVDPVSGVGCFVSVNGLVAGYYPDNISKYGCGLLRQAREGGSISRPADASAQYRIEGAEQYAGTYVGPDGDRFQFLARSDRLFLLADGQERPMQLVGERYYLSDHPRFGSHLFDFEHRGDAVSAVWFGAALYGRNVAPQRPVVPPELAALAGTYVGNDVSSGWWCSVFAQGEHLVLENIALDRDKSTLHRKGDYWQPEGPGKRCEQIRFGAVANGVPQRLSISGRDLRRFHQM